MHTFSFSIPQAVFFFFIQKSFLCAYHHHTLRSIYFRNIFSFSFAFLFFFLCLENNKMIKTFIYFCSAGSNLVANENFYEYQF